MMLGKRPRPPMKRTTSMSEISFDLGVNGTGEALNPSRPHKSEQNPGLDGLDQRLLSMVSPRNPIRNSVDFLETANFLRVCSLCKRPLVPGRDIYMYRGDSGFCSKECRQQQMNQDERKEKKCSLAASNKEGSGTILSSTSSKAETTATVAAL